MPCTVIKKKKIIFVKIMLGLTGNEKHQYPGLGFFPSLYNVKEHILSGGSLALFLVRSVGSGWLCNNYVFVYILGR